MSIGDSSLTTVTQYGISLPSLQPSGRWNMTVLFLVTTHIMISLETVTSCFTHCTAFSDIGGCLPECISTRLSQVPSQIWNRALHRWFLTGKFLSVLSDIERARFPITLNNTHQFIIVNTTVLIRQATVSTVTKWAYTIQMVQIWMQMSGCIALCIQLSAWNVCPFQTYDEFDKEVQATFLCSIKFCL